MSRAQHVCASVHTAALGIWLGALGMSVVSAAIVFPTVKALDPHLAAFDKYTGPHWLIAGGQVANRVFLVGDIVQFACVLTAGLTLGIGIMWLGLPVRRLSTFLRATLLLALVAVLAFRFGLVQPKWDDDVRQHWEAAKAGDNEAAARWKASLDAAHPTQTRLMGATAALVGSALALAVFATPRDEQPESP